MSRPARYGVGNLAGVSSLGAYDGLSVSKLGRTTSLTRGTATAFEMNDVIVRYPYLGNLSFRLNYVPLADLSRATSTESSALFRLLHGIKLVGAKPLPDGTVRGGLIRIAGRSFAG